MGQTSDSRAATKNLLEEIGTEGVYVHYNTNFLLTGEYLHFKLYALSKKNKNLSPISKVAYVELLDSDGNRKIIEKVKMIDGMGQGDIFVPTDLESGYYFLVAYTAYMKNWPSETFYSDELVVLNPYTNNQKVFWEKYPSEDEEMSKNSSDREIKRNESLIDNSGMIQLNVLKNHYATRERVELEIMSKSNGFGMYSMSVRQISDDFIHKTRLSPENYLTQYNALGVDNTIGSAYLPELRGELVRGRLVGANGQGIPNQKIIFSLPGIEYEFKMVPSDAKGNFIFSLDTENLEPESIFQMLGPNGTDYHIEIFDMPDLEWKKHIQSHFSLKKEMENAIKQRSVHNQIENAYFNVKPDTIKLDNSFAPIYGQDVFEYKLDDYTRFPTFKETLVEVIDNAWIATGQDGKRAIFVRDHDATRADVGYSPLVIVDGLMLQDHEDLIDLGIHQIKTIRLARNQYVLAGQIFQGVFDVETYDHDFADNYSKSYTDQIELHRPQPIKKYYKQNYRSEASFISIPDFRHQLFWEPGLKLYKTATKVEFYTSDIKGNFEIVLEGFNEQMRPIKIVKYFKVQ
jgi:hypothetical protein